MPTYLAKPAWQPIAGPARHVSNARAVVPILGGLYPVDHASRVRSICTGGTNPPTLTTGPWGKSLLCDATTTEVRFSGRGQTSAATWCSLWITARWDAMASGATVAVASTGSTAGGFGLRTNLSGVMQVCRWNAATFNSFGPGYTLTNGRWYTVAMTAPVDGASNCTLWVYDHEYGTLSVQTGSSLSGPAGDGDFVLNRLNTGAMRGAISSGGYLEAPMSDSSFMALVRDPCGLHRRSSIVPILAAAISVPAAGSLPWCVGDDGPSYGFFEA